MMMDQYTSHAVRYRFRRLCKGKLLNQYEIISIYVSIVNVALYNRTSDLPFYTNLLHLFCQYSLAHAHNRARPLSLSAQGENARQNLLFIMGTYGIWTEEDLDRALTALKNGVVSLNAIVKFRKRH